MGQENFLSSDESLSLLVLGIQFILDRLFNELDLIVSMILSILLNSKLLLFSDSTSPKLDLSELLLFVLFNLFPLFGKDSFVEDDDLVVIHFLRIS